jgi:predicted nucleic acid-binding protein
MKTVVVDTDALIALVNKDDSLALDAVRTLKNLYSNEVKLIYPSTTIVEAMMTFQRKLSNSCLASDIAQMLRDGQFNVVSVDQNILEQAEILFKPKDSKQNTMFDAVVAVIAQTTNADAIFSFDKWYEKNGLKLAASLFKA